MLKVNDINVYYGIPAIKGVSFEVNGASSLL